MNTAATVAAKIGKAIIALVAIGWLANLTGLADPPDPAEAAADRSQRIADTLAADDFADLRFLGDKAVASRLAITYSLSGWDGALDLTISSLLPGDARAVADIICTTARENFVWGARYEVRVFLPVSGDRPAAVCQI